MKQKNVKFSVNENKTAYSFGKFIGVMVGVVLFGFVLGIGVALATKIVPLSTQVLTP